MCTHDLCFELKFEKYHNFSLEIFHLKIIIFATGSILHRRVIVMNCYLQECVAYSESPQKFIQP